MLDAERVDKIFFTPNSRQTIRIFASTLDQPTDLKLVKYILAKEQDDYYNRDDHFPKHPNSKCDLVSI